MKTKSPLSRILEFAFGSAILALLAVGAISYRAIVVSSESDRWVRHTHEVIENLDRLRTAMQTLESSARGFLLTGKDFHLESYRASALHAAQEETIVRDLTLDNPVQQRQIPILHTLAAQKTQLIEKVFSLRRSEGLQAAIDAGVSAGGQQIMDD
jgi:CHASE3 domain sensor protein